jgi:glycerophosphoryl diester phosphodiesterase
VLRAIAGGQADGWFAWHADVTAATASLARELGLAVSCWTVDDERVAEISRLAALKVEAILSDRPDRLAKVFARH